MIMWMSVRGPTGDVGTVGQVRSRDIDLDAGGGNGGLEEEKIGRPACLNQGS